MPKLTIYLLRDEFDTPASAIGKPAKEYPVTFQGTPLGTLYVEDREEKPPAWAELFRGITDENAKFGKVRATSALYLTQAGDRLFALAFGQGRHLLKPGAFEERFGLLVVINILEANQLRSIDKRTFDTVDQNVRSQVSQRSAATEFGIDIEKDLIRGITGQPSDTTLGSHMTGTDSLSVSVDISIPKLAELLEKYLEAYGADTYKENFGWIDQIHQVGDKTPLKRYLDAKLVEKMEEARAKEGSVPGLWLAIPDIVDYSGVHRFRFTGSTFNHNDLHLPGFIFSLRTEDKISIDLLRARTAFAVDEDGYDVSGDKWPIYKCIHFEVCEGDKVYLLATGKWFCIRSAFTDEVNNFYDGIESRDLNWIAYQHDSETAYNVAVKDLSNGNYALMDGLDVHVGGVRDKIEFCDIYSHEMELIHVKRYGASSLLGHLFNQGLVSGEHLRADEKFLQEVNKHLPPSHRIGIEDKVPRDVNNFVIVFAIISESQEDGLHLPFFAKVALKNACTRLRTLGFTRIFKSKILVDAAYSRTQKAKRKK